MITVCIKWSAPGSEADERFAGLSAADQAALELALRMAETCHDDVVVISVGSDRSDKILREALACGAHRAIRIPGPDGVPSRSAARAVATAITRLDGTRMVWCGDYSADRGSGSFPGFLAADLGIGQALGLVDVTIPDESTQPFDVVRRLDGGRREIMSVRSTAVLSVEGSLVRLRRATLGATLVAQSMPIEIMPVPTGEAVEELLRPYRPRARSIPAPSGSSVLDRVRNVTDASTPKSRNEALALDPPAAARMILDRLRDWGYLE